MIPLPRAELVVEYGHERRSLGATDEPFIVRVLAKVLAADALKTIEDFDGIDDELVEQARAEKIRLRRLFAELVPDAAEALEAD